MGLQDPCSWQDQELVFIARTCQDIDQIRSKDHSKFTQDFTGLTALKEDDDDMVQIIKKLNS